MDALTEPDAGPASEIAKANIREIVEPGEDYDPPVTKADLGRALGVTRAQVSKMLKPNDRQLRLEELLTIAWRLSVPPSVLLTPREGRRLEVAESPHDLYDLEALGAWLWMVGFQPPPGSSINWGDYFGSAEPGVRDWQAQVLTSIERSGRFRVDFRSRRTEWLSEDGEVILAEQWRDR